MLANPAAISVAKSETRHLPALRALSWGLFRYAARQQFWISDQNATTRQGIGVGLWAGDGRGFPPPSLHRT